MGGGAGASDKGALRERQSLKSWSSETRGVPCLLLLGAPEKIQGWSPSRDQITIYSPTSLHPPGSEKVDHKPKPPFPRPKLPQCLYATRVWCLPAEIQEFSSVKSC